MSRPTFAEEGDRFLAIWAADYAAVDMERIKQAKAALDLPYRVHPRHATEPGEYERVLAVGSRPPFICDYAMISDRSDQAGVEVALRWVVTDIEDARATSMASALGAIFGPGVREISQAEIDGEIALRAFQRGEDI